MNPHRTLFSQHPLFQLAVAFALGISAASYLPAKFGFSLATCAVCSVVSMVLTLRQRVRSAGLALLMALFFAGETLALLEARTMPQTSFIEGESLTLTGVLDGPVEFARDRLYLSLRVEQQPVGRVWLLASFRDTAREQEYRTLQL
ncbi:MAG TPA: hypothetical protein VFH46_23735, partial [Pyrinomonadaceae bacterium]|nr:hypothetical protein [Pyrinomonadaceae bacterium]